jgi:hypothetical protein
MHTKLCHCFTGKHGLTREGEKERGREREKREERIVRLSHLQMARLCQTGEWVYPGPVIPWMVCHLTAYA